MTDPRITAAAEEVAELANEKHCGSSYPPYPHYSATDFAAILEKHFGAAPKNARIRGRTETKTR